MNTTTTGVLLIKAESGTVRAANATSARNSLVPATRRKSRARASIAPVLSNAALSTNMQPITIGALLLKTASVSSVPRMPVTKQQAHCGERDEVGRKPLPQERHEDQHHERENNDQMK